MILGALGLISAGPFLATLLIGRTGLVPSIRWLAFTLAVWVFAGGLYWAVTTSTVGVARMRDALVTAAPLSALFPLLVLVYLSDAAYHAIATGAAPRSLLAYTIVLGGAGLLWRLVTPYLRGDTGISSVPEKAASEPHAIASWRATHTLGGRDVAVLAPLAGLALMIGANDILFEPLGRPGAHPAAIALTIACLIASAALLGGGLTGALALALAWTIVGPLQAVITAEFTGPVLLASALGWTALLRASGTPTVRGGPVEPRPSGTRRTVASSGTGRRWMHAGGVLLGVATGVAPPVGGALAGLAIAGALRPALLGVASAVLMAATLAFLGDSTPTGGPLDALRGTPHLDNVALGAFHARLFSGPGGLTGPGGGDASAPAAALTLGALVAGVSLMYRAISGSRSGASGESGPPEDVVLPAMVGLFAGLLLMGTTPYHTLVAALPATAVLLRPWFWQPLAPNTRRIAAALAVTGYALAGTSNEMFVRAASELLNAWPPAASAPVLGLVLLSIAVLMRLEVGKTRVWVPKVPPATVAPPATVVPAPTPL